MTGTMQKIKNALTPGKHKDSHHRDDYYVTDSNIGTSEGLAIVDGGRSGYSEPTSASTYGQDVAGDTTHNINTYEQTNVIGAVEVPVVEQKTVTEHHSGVATGDVCSQRIITEVEDRPVVKERVERYVEHRPVEKQYVVEVKPAGVKEMGVTHVEAAGAREYVVEGPREVDAAACPREDPLKNIGEPVRDRVI